MRKWINGEIALGFLLATLFWFPIVGWLTAYSPTDVQKQECYEVAAKAGRSYEQCKSFWERATTDPIAVFTLVLAFSTVGLWGSTIALYVAGERQLSQLKDTSERQSADMQASIETSRQTAKAAMRSADVAERALAMTDRPWLAIDVQIAGSLSFGSNKVEIPIKWYVENVGKSPAIGVVTSFTLHPYVVDAQQYAEELARDSERAMGIKLFDSGLILFPGQKSLSNGAKTIHMRSADFVSCLANLNKNPLHPPIKGLEPAIYAFVHYKLPAATGKSRFRSTTLLLEINSAFAPDGFDGSVMTIIEDNIELVGTMFSGPTI